MKLRHLASALTFSLLFIPLARSQESTTVGGYGELHYNEPDGIARGTLDFHRFVLYVGHAFNDKLSFKSELEVEHTKLEAGEAEGGEVAVEQAYLDWHLTQEVGLRAGILIPPIGILNQFHEPPTFHGVERPMIDQVIIPTTWRESGAGLYGVLTEGVRYQLYLLAGLKAEGFSEAGIRGGRQEALESSPVNPSLTGRLEALPVLGLKCGASFFAGQTTEGVDSLGGGMLTLLSADAQYGNGPLSLKAVGVLESIDDAEKINAAFQRGVADRIYGLSVEGAYNILPLLAPGEGEQSLHLFARYERYNTQSKVTGFAANAAFDRRDVTLGATFQPTFNTAFKLDYQFMNDGTGAQAKRLNLGIGYSF